MTSAAARAILDELKPGLSVYVPGASGEPTVLREVFAADPERCAGVRFISCFVPGMNDFDYATLSPTARVTTYMMPPAMHGSFEAGRIELMPLPYSEIAEHLATRAQIDVAFFHLAPPDANGMASSGIASDFAGLVWPRARRRIALINPLMPIPPRSVRLPIAEADVVIEIESRIITGGGAPDTAEAGVIADHAASLVRDGAAIQYGIGGAPAAVLSRLTDRKNLTIRSGMVIEAVRGLWEAGALKSDPAAHITGMALGSDDFYRFLVESDLVAFADSRITHGAASLSTVENFTSINSALEIDLFGQANLEWRGERVVSGVGGAPDFVRAARRSPGCSATGSPSRRGDSGSAASPRT